MGFDFVGHEESYKLRNFLKYKIFDTNYADVVHKILFGTPLNLYSQTRSGQYAAATQARRRRSLDLEQYVGTNYHRRKGRFQPGIHHKFHKRKGRKSRQKYYF